MRGQVLGLVGSAGVLPCAGALDEAKSRCARHATAAEDDDGDDEILDPDDPTLGWSLAHARRVERAVCRCLRRIKLKRVFDRLTLCV